MTNFLVSSASMRSDASQLMGILLLVLRSSSSSSAICLMRFDQRRIFDDVTFYARPVCVA